MPNTGRPSRDCHQCRQRRIKCDLGRPGCGQCQRKGHPCPGYRNELDQRFRMENISSLASNRGKDRRKAGNKTSSSLVLCNNAKDTSERSVVPTTKPASHPQYPLAESWNDHFLPLVINKFSSDAVNGNHKTIFTAIPLVLSNAQTGSALSKVCDAVGRVYITNMTNSPKAKFQQARAYGNAIAAINADLQHPQRCESNETLVSVFLLCIYELLSATDCSSVLVSPEWCIHTRGMIALLNHRQGTGFVTQEDRSLFLTTFNTVQSQALMMNQDYSWEFLSWIHRFYKNSAIEESRVVRSAIFAHHCSRLCVVIQELIDTGNKDLMLAIYPSILHHADNVENETAPLSHDKFVRDCAIDPPRATSDPPNSIRNSGLRGYQSTFRLRLSTQVYALLSIVAQAPGCKPEQYEHILEAQKLCIEEFQTLADQILSMLASTIRYDSIVKGFDQAGGSGDGGPLPRYTIGLYDVFRVMWPLRLIISSPISSDSDRHMASTMLNTVHRGTRLL